MMNLAGLSVRIRLIVGLVVLLAWAAVIAWVTGGWSRHRSRTGQHAGSRATDRLAARRSLALEAIETGRFDRAFAFYRLIPDTDWRAHDCFKLGSVLLERKRLVLAWAALMAARRIDPEHALAAPALDSLEARITLATGSERSALHEAAGRCELLRSIGSGASLGLFALGLARYSSDTTQEDEFFDRLGNRDRSALRGVQTTAGAIKLTARLLMETGRTAEAVQLLDPLVEPAGTDRSTSQSAPIDREAAWLLSRAALQLDMHDRADELLALAGDFGTSDAALPEPAPFVGSRRCADCHPRIAREQQRESRHAQTLRFGAGLKESPLPAKPVPDPVIPSITHAFARKDDDRIELETRDADHVFRAVVLYAVGSGRHGITMIARDDTGIDRELRVSYFGLDQSWGQTKGIDFAPRDAGDHIGMGLGRKTLNRCLSCHTTWFRSVASDSSHAAGPEREDHGIGCERCHGPGKNHVKAAESGFAELAIALSAKTPSQERLKSCVECHAADGSIEPSDPEFTRAQGTTLLFSRCFNAGKDRFGCTTCHDPHRALDRTISQYEAKCLSCHGREPANNPAQAASGHERTCPVNPKDKCITCHMPQVEEPLRKSRFTDHHIRVHRASE